MARKVTAFQKDILGYMREEFTNGMGKVLKVDAEQRLVVQKINQLSTHLGEATRLLKELKADLRNFKNAVADKVKEKFDADIPKDVDEDSITEDGSGVRQTKEVDSKRSREVCTPRKDTDEPKESKGKPQKKEGAGSSGGKGQNTTKASTKTGGKTTKGKTVDKRAGTKAGNTPTGCPDHPKYSAIRTPRSDCKQCWSYYYELHPERKTATTKCGVSDRRSGSGCSDHPKYSGQRKPRSNCPGCWELYERQRAICAGKK